MKRDNGKVIGLVFGLLVFAALAAGALERPRLGLIDNGKYERVMEELGLEYLPEDLEDPDRLTYTRPIERFAYGHFSYGKLLAPGTVGSVGYLASAVRLATQPFGLDFSVWYLYFAYAALISLAAGVLVRGTAWAAGGLAVIPGAVLTLVFSDRNLTVYFASLYETGAWITGILLMGAALLRGFTYGKGRGFGTLWPAALAGGFLLCSDSLACVFLPLTAGALIALLIQERRLLSGKRLQAVLLLLLVLLGIRGGLDRFAQDPDITSRASLYHAVFQGILEDSRNTARDLEELGLDAGYAEDIGKSYYLEDSAYAHPPRDEKEGDILFGKLTRGRIAAWYLRHPLEALSLAVNQEGFYTFETDLLLGEGEEATDTTRITRSAALAENMFRVVLPSRAGFGTAVFGLGAAAALAAGFYKKKWREAVTAALWFGCCLMILPFQLFWMGRDSLAFTRLVWIAALTLCLSGLGVGAGMCYQAASRWFRRPEREAAVQASEAAPKLPGAAVRTGALVSGRPARGRTLLAGVWERMVQSRRNTVLTVGLLGLLMIGTVQFSAPRAGSVNNGDFGRMMEELGLIWTGDIYYDTEIQLGHRVIEEYAYRSGFDALTLTPVKPTYSLVFPGALTRGICTIMGIPFDTHVLSVIMSAVLFCCIASIVRDLYPKFGRRTIFLGTGLCAMFCCESYLVWFNSLFGESCIFLGFFMVLACCVHLSVLEPGRKGRGWLWVLALLFSVRILAGAKAQMLTALPVLLALALVFAFRHRPLRLGLLIPYTLLILVSTVLISYETVRIYQDNSKISDQATVWQSVFYGALMISDDPVGDMEELGIDVRMAADIGKDAYQPEEDYVYGPYSQEAYDAFYSHVNTFTMVKYYLRHPAYLLRMLNHAAQESRELYNGYRVYLGQDYTKAHDPVDRFGAWLYLRPLFTFGTFWGYAAAYGAAFAYGCQRLVKKKGSVKERLLIVTYLAVILTGAVQYPLSVIGNGFADNQKQMFGFALSYDVWLLFTGMAIVCRLAENTPIFKRGRRDKEEKDHEKDTSGIWNQAGGHQDVPAGQGAENAPGV